MKRQRVESSLTGGTRDVSPQWLTFTATESAADTTTTITQSIPVQRLPHGSMAQVMEVLKVAAFVTALPAFASATEVQDSESLYLSTKTFSTTTTNFGEATVFAGFNISQRGAFTAAGTYGMTQTPLPLVFDVTDGAGHGVLVATDNIYAQVSSVGTGNAVSFLIKILYRWKNVSLQEYIGIVQSQQ